MVEVNYESLWTKSLTRVVSNLDLVAVKKFLKKTQILELSGKKLAFFA